MGNSMDYSFMIIKKGFKHILFLFILFGIALFYSYFLLAFLIFLLLFWNMFIYYNLLWSMLVDYNSERQPLEQGNNAIVAPIDGLVKKVDYEAKSVTITISSSPFFTSILRVPFGGLLKARHIKGFCFVQDNLLLNQMGTFTELSFKSTYGEVICKYYPLLSTKNLTLLIPPFPIQKGERIGFMPYGILKITITQAIHLQIREGDKIKGNETIIGIFK